MFIFAYCNLASQGEVICWCDEFWMVYGVHSNSTLLLEFKHLKNLTSWVFYWQKLDDILTHLWTLLSVDTEVECCIIMTLPFTDTISITRKNPFSDTLPICSVSFACNKYCTLPELFLFEVYWLLKMWYLPVLCVFPLWLNNQTFTALDNKLSSFKHSYPEASNTICSPTLRWLLLNSSFIKCSHK